MGSGQENIDRSYAPFIFEKTRKFKIQRLDIPVEFKRLDLRVTVDYPDLVWQIFVKNITENNLDGYLNEIIPILDDNPQIKSLVNQFVDDSNAYE